MKQEVLKLHVCEVQVKRKCIICTGCIRIVSLYFKQKLRTQYANALDDAKKELV